MVESLLAVIALLIVLVAVLLWRLFVRPFAPQHSSAGRPSLAGAGVELKPDPFAGDKTNWRGQYRVESLLEGIDKFETEGWQPPPKWKSSDRIAFILMYLYQHPEKPLSPQYLCKQGQKAGDTTSDSAYAWWLGILEHEGMVVRDPDGQRPVRWRITCNRRPLRMER